MFRKKKIGIFGTHNSGKTVLLTSLLWHLYEFSSDRFPIGDKSEIKEMEFVNAGNRNFNYDRNVSEFVEENRWPHKTMDFQIARCKYKRTDSFWERDMTFVDIPGERVSDVFIWKAKDFSDWSEQLEQIWQGDVKINSCMEDFIEIRRRVEESPSETGSWDLLVCGYRTALISLGRNYSPLITPSTFVLTMKGEVITDSDSEKLKEQPIWDNGNFFPLPGAWKKSKNKILQQIYKTCESNFKKYRKEVLKPLYSEIDDCDNFIVCIDIFNILTSGKSRYYQIKKEINNFFQLVRPRKFRELRIKAQRLMNKLLVGRALPKNMQARPPKVAYVATKSDMAIKGGDKTRLHQLLNNLILHEFNGSLCIDSKLFTCSAGRTFGYDETRKDVFYLPSGGEETHFELDKWPQLPHAWTKWEPSNYSMFRRVGRPLQMGPGVPPRQDQLDRLFEFITED